MRKFSNFWTLLLMHLEAVHSAPRPYLIALRWRLLGKKLRARSQMAPLLGKSPRAYHLWIERQETRPHTTHAACAAPESRPIIALVDAGGGETRLAETLESLASEGLSRLLIGGPDGLSIKDAPDHIAWSDMPWLMPMAAGDILAPRAAEIYRSAIAKTQGQIVYADDDLIDHAGQRSAPHFKPDWNGELFRHFDFLTGACAVHASRECLASVSDADWAQTVVARTLGSEAPVHVPHILHHRRSRPLPLVPTAPAMSAYRQLPRVSVIIPTRNGLDLLQTCLSGLQGTEYPDMEILIVDNGSDDRDTLTFLAGIESETCKVLKFPGAFNFSAINNHAAAQAGGEMLCLLNNDVEMLEPHWLTIMVEQALRENVGAVGAQLLYPDGRIQHSGVVLGVGGGAAHAHRLLRPDEEGYFRRHALPQFVSAVTAACLVVSRERFMAVGGFDERNFAVAFNDVDLCMRLNRRGWHSLYEPRARLIHHESVSRGLDRDPVGAARLAGELAQLKFLWATDRIVDPFHHPQLSPFSEHFVPRL